MMRWYEIYESISTEEQMRQTLLDLLTPIYRQKTSRVPVNLILDQLRQVSDISGFVVDYDMLSHLVNNDPKQRFSKMLDADAIQKNDKGKLELVFSPPNDHSKEQTQQPENSGMEMDAEPLPDQDQNQDQNQQPPPAADQNVPPAQGGQPPPAGGQGGQMGGDQQQPNTGFDEFNAMAASGQNNQKKSNSHVGGLASKQLGKGMK